MTKSIFSAINDFSFDSVGSEAELIPLMTSEDEEALEKEELPEVVPLLPIKKHCFIPGCCYSYNSWKGQIHSTN